jgi:hypothetical protein
MNALSLSAAFGLLVLIFEDGRFEGLLGYTGQGAFATSEIVFIKELGIGTALAVLIDATIVRALLVPSLVALLGRWNWWAPRPLRRLHERVGWREAESVPA